MQFVVLFVVFVLTLLLGYRYAIETETNMRYLFMTAQHTSMLLSAIGESCELENPRSSTFTGWKRARLEAWRRGEEPPSATLLRANYGDEAPLTPLERWLDRAYETLHYGGSLDNSGPHVHFVAAYGLATLIGEADARGRALLEDTTLDQEARKESIRAAKKELESLKQEEAELPDDERKRSYDLADRQFTFILVPDCGAIEVISIFIAAVLAFPSQIRKRLLGLVIGIPTLYCVNILRLSSLAYLAAYDPTDELKWFNFAHEYVWQVVFIIFVVAVWLCWIEFVVQRRSS